MQLTGLHPVVRQYAQYCLDWAKQNGVPVTVTSARRSREQQAKLYRDWLAGRSKFPANPPGFSGHEYGLAWDSWVAPEYRDWWKQVREAVGFRVPPNDWIHAEVPDWQDWAGVPR